MVTALITFAVGVAAGVLLLWLLIVAAAES